MKSIHDIRLENARLLAEAFETLSAFSDYINKPADLVSRYMGSNPTKNIGDKMARHIEACFHLATNSLDQEAMDMSKDSDKQVREPAAVYDHLFSDNERKLVRQLNEALLTKKLDANDLDLVRLLLKRLSRNQN